MIADKNAESPKPLLSPQDRLRMVQLRLLHWMDARDDAPAAGAPGVSVPSGQVFDRQPTGLDKGTARIKHRAARNHGVNGQIG